MYTNFGIRFFVEAVRFLESHSTREGIFRKAGSVTRQKALKVCFHPTPILSLFSDSHHFNAFHSGHSRSW